MPSKKKATRAAQLHPQPAQSDYDTETDAAITTAPPPTRTNTELNLLVLRRYVPEIDHIVAIAPFAVVYLFSADTQQWEKSGQEGTLFLCQLSASDAEYVRYNVVILNRKSLDNFITELVSGEDIEITEQYVILQILGEDGTPSIYGLWIFEDGSGTKEIMASAIQECAMRAEQAREEWTDAQEDDDPTVSSYNLDGAVYDDQESEIEIAQMQRTGQQIDLLKLFGQPSTTSQSAPQQSQQLPMSKRDPGSNQFASYPADGIQKPYNQHQPQRDLLLGLFKGGQNG